MSAAARTLEDMPRETIISTILSFLGSIGLQTRFDSIQMPTFLPGLSVQNGVLVIDEPQLLYPGDLLHEAGHLAVLHPDERKIAGAEMGSDGGMEMAAIAWSYAATIHLGIAPSVVFHPHGYKGSSVALIENFNLGRYIGVPMLEWFEMTATGKNAVSLGVPPYPHMLRWLRE